ncbi:MAG: M4 family metallopeptidase [Caldilineaceae bacterium]
MNDNGFPRHWCALKFLVRVAGLLLAVLLLVGQAQLLYAAEGPVTQPTVQRAADQLTQTAAGVVTVSVHPTTGAVRFVRVAKDGDLLPTFVYQPTTPRSEQLQAKADAFFANYGVLFALHDPLQELVATGSATDEHGFTTLNYAQFYQGVPVYGALLRVHFDQVGRLSAVNGVGLAVTKLDPTPTVDPATAEAVAKAEVQQRYREKVDALQAVAAPLYIVQPNLLKSMDGPLHLAYVVEVVNTAYTVRQFVFVDAHTGKLLLSISGIHELEREIYEGSLNEKVWDEGNGDPEPIPSNWPNSSAAQRTAWNDEIAGAKEAYNLFASLTNGNWLSYDSQEAVMHTVNNDPTIQCPNANWNSVSTNYCNGVTGDDTVAHEWAHAYTEHTSNLLYAWQPGALNESFSDIWGEVADLLNGRGKDSPATPRTSGSCSTLGQGNPAVDNSYRWLAGEDDTAFGGAIRDMWNPTCYNDPGKMSDNFYACDADQLDNGGVHTNSGIPNHLFALLVDGGAYNNVSVGAIGLTRAAHIHWRAQSVYETPVSDFNDHADALLAACTDLIGQPLFVLTTGATNWGAIAPDIVTAATCTAVANAIAAVELRTPPSQCNFQPLFDPNAPPLCTAPAITTTLLFQGWENGLGGWRVGSRAVAAPATFDIPNWALVDALPDAQAGHAIFGADPLLNGDNCNTLDSSGVTYVESPSVTIPPHTAPRLAFTHWVATEARYDGGNVKVERNGNGIWLSIPTNQMLFNPYNNFLLATNPLRGEDAFTGSDGGSVSGSWVQTQIDLSGLVLAGDTIKLRFELGVDQCNGLVGWYVDDIRTYACTLPPQLMITPTAVTVMADNDADLAPIVKLHNGGDGVLIWQAAASLQTDCATTGNVPWISGFSAPNGAVDAGETDSLGLLLDLNRRTPGLYTAALCLTSNDPITPLYTIPITVDLKLPPADLELRKVEVPTAAQPGQPLLYQWFVQNHGPSLASNVVITDLTPSALTVISATAAGATLTPITVNGGPTSIWQLSDLPVNAAPLITIGAIVSPTLSSDQQLTSQMSVGAVNDEKPTNNQAAATIAVTVPRLRLGATTLQVSEGAPQPLTAVIDRANPYAPVQVRYTTVAESATAGVDYLATTGIVTIPAGAASVEIPLQIVDDARIESDERFQVQLSAVLGAQLESSTATITIVDDDVAGLALTPPSGMTSESGGTVTLTATLTAQPSAGVTVTFTSGDSSEGIVNAQLYFAPERWNVSQTIVVTGVDDAVDDGDVTYKLQSAITSADPDFAALAPVTINLVNQDDEVAQLTVVQTALAPSVEIGDVVTYTYQVTNSGTVSISAITAMDDRLGAIPLGVTSLAPGQQAHAQLTHLITLADLPGPLLNRTTVTGRSVGDNLITGQAQAKVKLLDVELLFAETVGIVGITPACSAKSLHVPVGTTVQYCYRVKSEGSITMNRHTLADSALGVILDDLPLVLSPGASYATSTTASLSVSVTNVATWTATLVYKPTLPDGSISTAPLRYVVQDTATVTVSGATDDQDQDSIPDNVEGAGDADQDNLPNFLDPDADNDGLTDRDEAGPDPLHPRDANNNGVPDYLEADGSLSRRIFLPFVSR